MGWQSSSVGRLGRLTSVRGQPGARPSSGVDIWEGMCDLTNPPPTPRTNLQNTGLDLTGPGVDARSAGRRVKASEDLPQDLNVYTGKMRLPKIMFWRVL